MIWVYISELLLYLSFSILTGTLIIQLVPKSLKPTILLNKRIVQLSIIGIMVFSAAPVLRLVQIFYKDQGLLEAMLNVIRSFEVGRAWSLTVVIALFFFLLVTFFPVFQNRKLTILSMAYLFALILVFAWASHSTSIANWSGFVFHTLHYAAVITWVGILLVVGWFSIDSRNWLQFLSWFTSVAVICLMFIFGSGIILMQFVLDTKDYGNAWAIPYGQALLIKHLLILPVLIFAFINGIWAKRKLEQKEKVNPLPWVKVESVALLLVFAATAVLGQQEPPLNIDQTLLNNGPSALFDFFYAGTIDTVENIQINFSNISVILFILSAIFALIMLYAFKMRASTVVSFVMGLLCTLCLYLGFMSSIQ
ncbi:copper resistance D family protein [Paenisporosarcina indica]|uniref:copper resistance D family protein n=1 Tax=Paenisporosarcina indica TaxID=650093 RepID=UPI00094F7397|nr:CopD family protein [Paenisporosarcina indica]